MPNVEFPPKTPRPPTGPTYQRILSTVLPVSWAVNVTVFIGPAGIVTGEEGEVMVTTGAGTTVTVEVAVRFWSSNDLTPTMTVGGEGTVTGAW